jgi:hypothetical protein
MDTKEYEYKTKAGATITRDHIASLIIDWAESYLGVKEEGNNKGVDIERFQRIVDGVANMEAWCMCFCQAAASDVSISLGVDSPLYKSEGCVEVWNNTNKKYQTPMPSKGSIMIHKEYTSWRGHAGIVSDPKSYEFFDTIEGNTNDGGEREGDGVYRKKRSMRGTSNRMVLGFIDLPQMILDKMKEKGI